MHLGPTYKAYLVMTSSLYYKCRLIKYFMVLMLLLVTCASDVVTHTSDVVTCGLEVVTFAFNVVTCNS